VLAAAVVPQLLQVLSVALVVLAVSFKVIFL
jgi:hypothetical protein